jgi:hypothetical protein
MWPTLVTLWFALSGKLPNWSAPRRRPVFRCPSYRPRLEGLEGRTVLSTLHVTNVLDDGSPGSLRSEMNEASPGDTIVFDSGLAGQTITLNTTFGFGALRFSDSFYGPVTAPGNITTAINGPPGGITISGGHNTGVFSFNGSNGNPHPPISMSNLNIVDSHVNLDDAAIYMEAVTLNLENCILSGNQRAIYGNAANVTIDHCTVSGNSSETAVIANNNGYMTIDHSAVSGNSSLSGDSSDLGLFGGGIFNTGIMTIDHSTVTGNSANYGGGIYTHYGRLAILSSVVAGNTAPVGADIYNLDSNVTISGSTVGDVANFGTVTLIASNVGSITNGSGGTVFDPAAEINNLIAQVAGLNLTADQQAGLTNKLQAAQQSLASANTTAAANQLEAFINQTNALVKSHKLGEITADSLINQVDSLIVVIE